MKPADVHRQLCEVYEEHATHDSVVWRWVRHFNEGCENVHDDTWSSRLFVVNEDLVDAVEEKTQENRRFTILSLSLHFPQILQSLLYEIVSDKLRFWKLCSRWVQKMLTDEHKMKRQASALNFLTRYSEQGDDIFSHMVTGNKTWVLHITPELKQQFHDDSEVKEAIKTWFASQAASFYDAGIQNLVPH
jgi:hypothetical protein